MTGRIPICLIKNRKGQALVESAIVIPLMTFIILGTVQLAMIQHARLMTEYAAFNAARAGIVWNADRFVMENAAIISLLPTFEGLVNETSAGNPTRLIMQIVQRALIYQAHRRVSQASDFIRNGTDALIGLLAVPAQGGARAFRDAVLNAAESAADTALRNAINAIFGTQKIVEVDILSPKLGDFGGVHDTEITFDDVMSSDGRWRDKTRLSIQVTYLYTMRIPWANNLVHTAYIAGQVGQQLYGAVWNPQTQAGATGFSRTGAPLNLAGRGSSLTRKLWQARSKDVYMIPLRATYSMRMQSNPYRRSVAIR